MGTTTPPCCYTDANGSSCHCQRRKDAEAALATARADALREAAEWHEERAKDEDALSSKYRGGTNPWFAHVQVAKSHRDAARSILALIPQEKPAEINWRDDPTAIVEDDEPQTGRDYA